MTITRTAKGTATDKTGALTLTIAGVQLEGDGSSLFVGLAYDSGAGAPTIRWGQQWLEPIVTQSGGGVVCRAAVYLRQGESVARNLVATWSGSAPTAKAMFATELTDAAVPDLVASQSEAGTTDPDSGAASTPDKDPEVYFGVFASEGPESDTPGTIQNGYSDGQRAGTAGAPPVSNVTVHEVFKIVTAAESTAAAKTGATSRNHSTCLVTLRKSTRTDTGMSGASDLQSMRNIFNAEIPSLPRRDHAFHHNPNTDEWEIFQVEDLPAEPAAANVTKVARYDEFDGWVVLI